MAWAIRVVAAQSTDPRNRPERVVNPVAEAINLIGRGPVRDGGEQDPIALDDGQQAENGRLVVEEVIDQEHDGRAVTPVGAQDLPELPNRAPAEDHAADQFDVAMTAHDITRGERRGVRTQLLRVA